MRENKPPEMLAALKNEYTKKHAMLQRLQQMVSANSIPGSSAPVAPPQMPTINNPVVPEVTPSNPAFSGNKSQVPSTMDPQVLLNMVKNNPQQQYPPDVMAQINKLIEHQQQKQHLQGRANISELTIFKSGFSLAYIGSCSTGVASTTKPKHGWSMARHNRVDWNRFRDEHQTRDVDRSVRPMCTKQCRCVSPSLLTTHSISLFTV